MKNLLLTLVFVFSVCPLFADEIVENFETGLQDPFTGNSTLNWIGDVGAFEIASATWPSYVSFDFTGNFAIKSKHQSIKDTSTILTSISSVCFSNKKIRWEVFISGNSAEITTGKGASLILFVNSSNIDSVEEGSVYGYRLRLCDPSSISGWDDGLYFEKANGTEWEIIDSVHTDVKSYINQGWNIAVERDIDGNWSWGYSNGAMGTILNLTESVTDNDYNTGKYSGMLWYSPAGDSDKFGFDNFKIDPYTPGLWKSEAGSIDWYASSNWDDGVVPSPSSSIQIEAGLYQPIINSNICCENLTLEPGSNLTINNGFTLLVNGDFSLQSNADGTASIVDNGILNILGASSIQRYMECYDPGANNEYHFLSIPVASHAVETSLLNYYVYPFDETKNEWAALSYGDQVLKGKGYSVYYSLDRDHCIIFSGTPNTGDQIISITASDYSGNSSSDNWNLIGNPFLSPIDWDLVTKDNVESAIYIWNAETCTYASYVSGVGTNFNDDGIIPAMQGFFVHASSSGDLTIPQTARVHNQAQDYLMKTDFVIPVLKISLSNKQYSDECVIRLKSGTTELWDKDFDAMKFLSGKHGVPQIFSLINEDIQVSINSLSEQFDQYEIPLVLKVDIDSVYDLYFRGVPTFVQDYKIILADKISGEHNEITKDSCYQLNLVAAENEQFALYVERKKTDIQEGKNENIRITVFADGRIDIENISPEFMGGELKVVAIDGKEIYSAGVNSQNMQFSIGRQGLCIIQLISIHGLFSKKIIIL